jgi:hypothetical protein
MQENHQFRFSFVLAAMLVYWLIAPLLQQFLGMRVLTDIFFSATLISAVYAVSKIRSHAAVASVLALPMLVAVWLQYLGYQPALDLVASIFQTFFFGYAGWLIVSAVLRASSVSREVIAAAIVVYMFLGMIWAGFYSTLELLIPGAFLLPEGMAGPTSQHFGYFSFTTLTTLGYGDITPLSKAARSAATLEALIGQIYLAVLIARLVGIHASQSSRR